MKATEIIYERTVSRNFNNEKIGIVLQVEDGEKAGDVLRKAKLFVSEQFGEHLGVFLEEIPF